jgi:uncharacterized protein YbaR (Trm112 family)
MARCRGCVMLSSRSSGTDSGVLGDSGRNVVRSIEPWLREILVCPRCHASLADGESLTGEPELECTSEECGLIFRVDDGIPVLLIDEARAPSR